MCVSYDCPCSIQKVLHSLNRSTRIVTLNNRYHTTINTRYYCTDSLPFLAVCRYCWSLRFCRDTKYHHNKNNSALFVWTLLQITIQCCSHFFPPSLLFFLYFLCLFSYTMRTYHPHTLSHTHIHTHISSGIAAIELAMLGSHPLTCVFSSCLINL